jgi:glycerophosphoryl diester phosphodiesterase
LTHPFLTEGRPVALAHRGGGDRRYENTWRAFEGAIALGYTHLETDVWATADGQLMLFHDDDLQRVADRPGRIGDLPLSDVRKARVAGSEPIPLLSEVLTTWPGIHLNIDLKSDAAVAPFIELVGRLRVEDRICVASFSDRRIRQVADALDRPPCLGAGRTAVARLVAAGRRPRKLPDVLQLPAHVGPIPLITQRLVDTLHGWGVAVHAWTINDAATMTKLLDLGVDALISDETETLRSVLLERKLWL